MSTISRRALFGLGVGAVAATVVKVPAAAAIALEATPQLIVERRMPDLKDGYVIDLTPQPPRFHPDSDFSHVERCA